MVCGASLVRRCCLLPRETVTARPPEGLSADDRDALATHGFVVVPGPYSAEELPRVQAAYDDACTRAATEDVHVGRASTRVTDFVNRGAIFDSIYTWPPALDAARQVVGDSFRLSVLHARTLHRGAPAQELHVDVPRTSDAWPMLGLILLVFLIVLLLGALPSWPYSRGWGYYPSGLFGVILVIVLIWLLLGHF